MNKISREINEVNSCVMDKNDKLLIYKKQVVDYIKKKKPDIMFASMLEDVLINDLGWKKE